MGFPHSMRPTPASGAFTAGACLPACLPAPCTQWLTSPPLLPSIPHNAAHYSHQQCPPRVFTHWDPASPLRHPQHSGLPHWGPVLHHQHPRLASAELVQETWSACALHSTLPSTVFSANTNLFKVLEKYLIRVEIHLTLRVCGVREDWCGEAAVCG